MNSVSLSGLTFAHQDSVPLIQALDLRLFPGWTGVVGPNGSGKTTLLRLLLRELEPDAGSVVYHPESLVAHLCPQRVSVLTPGIEAFARDLGGSAQRVRGLLELEPRVLERWDVLSPGERKRWQLGAALVAKPALLMLDEPTNHLDAHGRDLLIGALPRFASIGLVVSHDRALLEALTGNSQFHDEPSADRELDGGLSL